MGVNPRRSGRRAPRPSNLPVESVTWDEANEFCQQADREGEGPAVGAQGVGVPAADRGRVGVRVPRRDGRRRSRSATRADHARQAGAVPARPATTRSATAATGTGRRRRRRRSARPSRTSSACTTCTGTWPSGAPTGTSRATRTARGQPDRPGRRRPAGGPRRVVPRPGGRRPLGRPRRPSRPTERRDDVGFRVVYAPEVKSRLQICDRRLIATSYALSQSSVTQLQSPMTGECP